MSQNVYLRNKLKQLTTSIGQPKRDASQITWDAMLRSQRSTADLVSTQRSVVGYESRTPEMRYAGNPRGFPAAYPTNYTPSEYISTPMYTVFHGGVKNRSAEELVLKEAGAAMCGGSNCDTPNPQTNYVVLPSTFWEPTVTVPDRPCEAAYRPGIVYTGPQQFDPFRGGTRPVFARGKVWTPSGLGLPRNQLISGNRGYPNDSTPFP